MEQLPTITFGKHKGNSVLHLLADIYIYIIIYYPTQININTLSRGVPVL